MGSLIFLKKKSLVALEFGAFLAVQLLNIIGQIVERGLNGLNEVPTARGHAAHIRDGLAFGKVIGHSEDFAILSEPVGGALDHLVGGLTGPRVKNFYFGSGESR